VPTLGVMSVVGSFLLILIALSVSWLFRTNRESRAAQIENNI
jgi:spermidine/putrescine transport system permease protein